MSIRYSSYLEEPGLDAFRLDYCPRDDLATVLVCPWVIVTGKSGATYNVMRALPLPEAGLSLNFGAYRGNGVLDAPGELVFPFRDDPALQPFHVGEDEDAITYGGRTFALEVGTHAVTWSEASGRIELQVQRLGKAATFWVPEQPGVAHPLLSRSHMGRVSGVIDGDEVDGLFMMDFIYSRPGLTFRETDFTTDLHNYWMNWLVEYEDGEIEGGFAWRGQPGTGFAAAHHFVDGKSLARHDARIDVERTGLGTMREVTLRLGRDLEVVFEQHGSYDWPIHTYGTVKSISRGKPVARSWNYSENFPLNWGSVEDLQAAYAKLHGRYPSLQGLLKGARVCDGAIVVDGS
jgi:hypothetical protein